jgi:hypothetical protein
VRLNETLFLTEGDQHWGTALGPRELRATILRGALFHSSVLVTDSVFNNNVPLRSLISPDLEQKPSVHADFADLVRGGHLRPVIREGMTLGDLRREHLARDVENVPDQEYTDFVEALLPNDKVTFDPKTVADLFYAEVVALLTAALQSRHHGTRAAARILLDEVEGRGSINYNDLRLRMGQLEAHGVLSRDERWALDGCIGSNFVINVPASLGVPFGVPAAAARAPFAAVTAGTGMQLRSLEEIRIVRELVPTVAFNPEFLAKLPSRVLSYVKGSEADSLKPLSSYAKVLDLLLAFRAGSDPDFDAVAEALVAYLWDLERVFREVAPEPHRDAIAAMRHRGHRPPMLSVLKSHGPEAAVSLLAIVPDLIMQAVASGLSLVMAAYGFINDLRKVTPAPGDHEMLEARFGPNADPAWLVSVLDEAGKEKSPREVLGRR